MSEFCAVTDRFSTNSVATIHDSYVPLSLALMWFTDSTCSAFPMRPSMAFLVAYPSLFPLLCNALGISVYPLLHLISNVQIGGNVPSSIPTISTDPFPNDLNTDYPS